MSRRVLATLAVAVLGAVAGCGGGTPDAGGPPPHETIEPATPPPPPPAASRLLREKIAAAKVHGFFEGESVAAAARRIRAEHWREWEEEIDPTDADATLVVLGYDRKRVWWEDVEAGALPGNDAYVDTLRGWAAISRGAFAPRDIEEKWHGDEGPVEVTYDLNRTRRTLRPDYLVDWLDLEILCDINDQIAPTGTQFAMVEPFDQTAYVVALREGEHAAVKQLLPGLRADACSVASGSYEVGTTFEEEVLRDLEE